MPTYDEKKPKKQRAIPAAQKTSFDGNASLSDENEEEMEHFKNDDPSYKACRSSEAEASQSTSKNAPSSHGRKSVKLFAQTCDRFQIPDRAAAALLHFYVTLKLSLLIDKSKVRCDRLQTKKSASEQ